MAQQAECRFITHPTVLDKTADHTVVLIDCNKQDTKFLEIFFKSSRRIYDVYFYSSSLSDVKYLNTISKLADEILIDEHSHIRYSQAIVYGEHQKLISPMTYFREMDSAVYTEIDQLQEFVRKWKG
jgi:hypothetical protein